MSDAARTPPTLSTATAIRLATAAVDPQANGQLALAAAVVDAAGHLLAFARHEGAFLGAIDAAQLKARTSVFFRRETGAMQDALEQGKTAYLALPGVLPLDGGVPLLCKEGRLIGALGISGATSAQDGALARKLALELARGERT